MSRTRDFADLINGISAAKITSGSLDAARLSNIDSDYIQLRQATADLSNLNASNLTSGTIPNARVPSAAVTQHVSAVTNSTGTWTPSFSTGSISITHGARYQRVGDLVTVFCYIRAGGSITNNTTVIYMNGLPFTSRNTGNTYDYVGSGFIVTKSSTGIRVSCAVRSNSSSVYFLSSNGDLRAISDYQGLSGGSSVRDTSHYATQRNFQGAFDTSQDAHMLMKLSYLV